MRRTSHHLCQFGFTLVEMLLVVAIISLLISILLPALGKVRDKAQISICVSNLKSIYGASIEYSVANQRKLPSSQEWVTGYWWYEVAKVRSGTLYPYMGENEAAYICPEFVDSRSNWHSSFAGRTAAWTYSLNEYFQRSWKGQPPLRTIAAIRNPDQILMYSDENPWVASPYSGYTINNGALGVGQLGTPGNITDSIGSYHNPPNGNLNEGFANVLFVDGHVDLVHVSESKLVATPMRVRDALGWTVGMPY